MNYVRHSRQNDLSPSQPIVVASATTAKDNALELIALKLLAEADGPVGSMRLAEAFQAGGFPLAQATAGRFLYQLDQRGFTRVQNGKRGRVVTKQGLERLRELEASTLIQERGVNLMRAVNVLHLSDLVDLLVVRRAVETEAARYAAIRGTDAELADIAEQAKGHVCTIHDHRFPDRESSIRFHRSVAEASHNEMLISVALLLLEPGNSKLNVVLEDISVGSDLAATHASDHAELAEALLSRDADRSAEIMYAHMSRLIDPARLKSEIPAKGSRIEKKRARS